MKKYLNIKLPTHLENNFVPYDVLILEDDENRIDGFTKIFAEVGANVIWVDTAQECINTLQHKKFDIIFLDHDLGGQVFINCMEKNTGSEVARWINNNPLDENTLVIIHSANTVGSDYMNHMIFKSHKIPFAWATGIGKIKYKI